MSPTEVAVIDYGVGNLRSVRAALEHCGAQVQVTDAPAVILRAARVVLPGVGAFGNGMSELRRRGLDEVAREVASRGVPLLGICLGMQMLLDESEEFGLHPGLGLIPGRVVPVPLTAPDGQQRKIPHIGWATLTLADRCDRWADTLLRDITDRQALYFVHSFMAAPGDAADRVADALYGGARVCAMIGRGNVFGCQFHPEKSGEAGLRFLRAFLAS